MIATLAGLRRSYHAHWQNLDEDRMHRPKGKGWRHGRAWLSLGRSDETRFPSRPLELSAEWTLGRLRGPGFRLALGEGDGDSEAEAALYLPGFSLYLSALSPLTRRLTALLCRNPTHGYRHARELSLTVHHRSLWWRLWTDPWGGDDRPRWRSGHVDVPHALRGRMRYAEETLEEREVVIGMPERAYPATARLFVSTWRSERFRWWPARRVVRATIDVPGGIPEPGKGENAWDCGEDGLFSWTGPADSLPEAIGKVVESVLERRERYGGPRWEPSAAAPR